MSPAVQSPVGEGRKPALTGRSSSTIELLVYTQSGRWIIGVLRSQLRPQPVNATHALNRSAGVSKFSVFLGRSLSRLATAFSFA